jgi:serine phosphatase RsbU (regulator of sigma subunit)
VVERLHAAGIVLGVHDSSVYTSAKIHFEPGDLLILYTDGITEAQNKQGEMYDEDRLLRFLQSHRTHDLSTLMDGLVSEIRDFTGHSELDDDFTVVALRRKDS